MLQDTQVLELQQLLRGDANAMKFDGPQFLKLAHRLQGGGGDLAATEVDYRTDFK